MTWTALTFSYGSTLTSTKMTQLQANITAMCNGDSGAPQVQTAGIADAAVTNAKIGSLAISQSQLASSSVGQGQLKKSTQQSSASVGASTMVEVSFTGGLYTLGWSIRSGGSGSTNCRVMAYPGAAYGTAIGFYNSDSSISNPYYFQAYYFTASPPYDLGDGEVPLFIYVEVEPSGKVVRVDVAQDPPWIYNGPNRIDPTALEYARDGKVFRTLPEILAEHGSIGNAIRAGLKKDIVMKRIQTDAKVRAELTMADKLRDMNVIPHPFADGVMKPGNRILLLDPVSPYMKDLLTMHEQNDPGYNISELLMNGDFSIDNTPIATRKGPLIVPVHGFQWNLT